MKYKTKSGVELNGSAAEIKKILSAMGEEMSGIYISSEGEPKVIAEMTDYNLTGAIARRYRKWADTMTNKNINQMMELLALTAPTDQEFKDLITELVKRAK